jgi:hypothetical protein
MPRVSVAGTRNDTIVAGPRPFRQECRPWPDRPPSGFHMRVICGAQSVGMRELHVDHIEVDLYF